MVHFFQNYYFEKNKRNYRCKRKFEHFQSFEADMALLFAKTSNFNFMNFKNWTTNVNLDSLNSFIIVGTKEKNCR